MDLDGAVIDYNSTVERNLIVDWTFSVKPWLETLLDNGFKVMVYNGQEDVILSGPQGALSLISLDLCYFAHVVRRVS